MSRSISVRSRLTSVPSRSNGSISCSTPPMSSGVAWRRLSSFSSTTIVPMPSCVNTSISSAPSTANGRMCERSTPPRQARTQCSQVEARCRSAAAAPAATASSRSASASASSVSIGACRVGGVLADAGDLGDEQQLVGLQGDRRARRDVFHRQVERLAGRREAERREQQHRADVDRAPDRRRVDLADDAAVHEVDAVDDADRPRRQEVARDDADDRVGHRRVRQALRERRLDLEAQLAGGFLGAVERDRVGDAQALADSATRGPSSAAAR